MFSSTYKRSDELLSAESSLLLVVDVQEKFSGVIPDYDAVVEKTSILCKACHRLDIPVYFTEQYPKGLGPTDYRLTNLEIRTQYQVEKLAFSALGKEGFMDTLKNQKRRQVLIAGVEAHVCVLQTALDLLANYEGWVYCAADAVASRAPESRELALKRMEKAGINIVTVEMALFEWLREAGSAEFKELQALIK